MSEIHNNCLNIRREQLGKLILYCYRERKRYSYGTVANLLTIEEKTGREIAQKKRMVAMDSWCQKMKIRATPSLFINGYELPDSYRVNELKNFL